MSHDNRYPPAIVETIEVSMCSRRRSQPSILPLELSWSRIFDRELGDLILNVMKHQRADIDEHPTVLEHRFDLGHQRVVDLKRLDRAERRLGEQRPCRGDGVDDIGLVQPSRPTLSR
jgi:hypothetical protein